MSNKMLFMLILIALCFSFTACKHTPENEIIVNREGDIIERPIYVESLMIDEVPTKIKKESVIENTNMVIKYDAEIVVPFCENYPVVKVSRNPFSTNEIISMLSFFAPKENIFYSHQTKEELELLLVNAKKGTVRNGEVFVQEELIKVLEEQIQGLSNNEEKSIPFHVEDLNSEPFITELQLDIENEQGKAGIYLPNNMSFNYIRYKYGAIQDISMLAGTQDMESKISPAITKEEAQSIAEKACRKLGAKNLVVDSGTEARLIDVYTSNILCEGWIFDMQPSIHELQTYYISKGYTAFMEYLPTIVAPWEKEEVTIYVSDKGIGSFSWQGRTQSKEFISENIEMASLEYILEKAENYMKFRYALMGTSEDKFIVTIHKIALGTCLLSLPNEEAYGQYVPSWYVFYTIKDSTMQVPYEESLVLAANDGGYVEPRMTNKDLMAMMDSYANKR